MKMSLLVTMIALVFLASCTKNEVTELKLNSVTKSFTLGQTDSLIATVTTTGDISKFPVTWSTSNNSVVSVTNGKIVGKSQGTATITATSGEKEASCVVAVSNEIYPTTSIGELDYLGDAFKANVSHAFFVVLYSKSDTLILQTNSSLSVTDSLPVGKYQVLTIIQKVQDIIPFTLMSGIIIDGKKNNSWYLGVKQHPIVKGSMVVTSSSGKYTIVYNFIDDYGNTINGAFQGLLKYYDATHPSAVKSIFKTKASEFTVDMLNLKLSE